MKSKMIIALTVLITLAITSVNAQAVRERKQYQREGIAKAYGNGNGKISKHDRHRIARERHHYRRDKFSRRHDRNYSYREKRYQRYDRRNGRFGYDYRNNYRRFD